MKLKTIVVDDEHNCRINLKMLLDEFCPEIEVVAIAESAAMARELIKEHNPDVIFLDIKMPGEDGFSFLKSLSEREFSVVFTTAHNEYALKAFKENAIDYLEKPIDIEDLKNTVKKLVAVQESKSGIDRNAIKNLLESVVDVKENGTVAITTTDGFVMVKNEEIIYLEADENYTTIYLTNNRKYVSCGTIKKFEDILNKKMFFRTHRSYIINMTCHLKEFSRKEGNMVIMSNNVKLPVARRTLQEFFEQINTI